MKRMLGMLLCVCLIAALLAGCGRAVSRTETDPAEPEEAAPGTGEQEKENEEPEEQTIGFRAQYVRTDGYHDREGYPKTVWITSAGELREYCEANKDYYWMESVIDPNSGRDVGFTAAVSGYDDAFFADHDLLFVLLEEGSGSVSHGVTQVKAVPSADGRYILQTEIDRFLPEVGTDDMAEWHIMIEVEKKYGKTVCDEVVPVITDKAISGQPEAACRSEVGGDTVSVTGPYGQISVYLPDTWTAEAAPMDSGKLTYGLYGLILKPADAPADHIELTCTDSFGVCGTGLSEEKRELAGTEAVIGTFDGHAHWDFIAFPGDEAQAQVVAQHTDGYSWTAAIWNEAMAILDTMRFDRSVAEGGAGQYIPESENDEAAVFMDVSHVTASGLTVRFRQCDERDYDEIFFGEGYALSRLEGDEWTEVPQVIDNGRFTEEAIVIPALGERELETDWEWLYGILTPGTYRITKTVWVRTDGGTAEACSLTAQFILAG